MFNMILKHAHQWSPLVIAAGLIMLVGHNYWAIVPVATAISIVALGATFASVGHFKRSAMPQVLIGCHAITYASIYLMVVAVLLHPANDAVRANSPLWLAGDLLLSASVMSAAGWLCGSAWGRLSRSQ